MSQTAAEKAAAAAQLKFDETALFARAALAFARMTKIEAGQWGRGVSKTAAAACEQASTDAVLCADRVEEAYQGDALKALSADAKAMFGKAKIAGYTAAADFEKARDKAEERAKVEAAAAEAAAAAAEAEQETGGQEG